MKTPGKPDLVTKNCKKYEGLCSMTIPLYPKRYKWDGRKDDKVTFIYFIIK